MIKRGDRNLIHWNMRCFKFSPGACTGKSFEREWVHLVLIRFPQNVSGWLPFKFELVHTLILRRCGTTYKLVKVCQLWPSSEPISRLHHSRCQCSVLMSSPEFIDPIKLVWTIILNSSTFWSYPIISTLTSKSYKRLLPSARVSTDVDMCVNGNRDRESNRTWWRLFISLLVLCMGNRIWYIKLLLASGFRKMWIYCKSLVKPPTHNRNSWTVTQGTLFQITWHSLYPTQFKLLLVTHSDEPNNRILYTRTGTQWLKETDRRDC